MELSRQIAAGFSQWLNCVAGVVVATFGRIAAPRLVRLSEQTDGTFAVEAPGAKFGTASVRITNGVATCSGEAGAILKGSQIELAMRPSQFLFRPLELPRRAAEFLDGIVRAQIDRITPWTASEAAVGWTQPTDIGGDKISVTVAAAPLTQIAPFARAVGALSVKSVFISTTVPGPYKAAIKVFTQSAGGTLELRQVRRLLLVGFVGASVIAGLASAADFVIGGNLQNRHAEVARSIAERRGIIRAGNDAIVNSALARLALRKNQTPADVIVLEALSNVLPDHTYVTELRIEGDKVQVIGITNDAPSLIRLIEQSPHFSHATFFAPTTHAPSDPGDRYHIEARIKPVFAPPS